MCGILLYGLHKACGRVGVFLEGAREGLATAVDILPALVALMTCVGYVQGLGVPGHLHLGPLPLRRPLPAARGGHPPGAAAANLGQRRTAIYDGLLQDTGRTAFPAGWPV